VLVPSSIRRTLPSALVSCCSPALLRHF